MKLSLDALLVLDAIDRKGSFAAAANELHRVPSAITYSMQKLEQDLNVALFDRSGHRARLTDAGELLLKEGRHLIDAALMLEQRLRKHATGWESELRIALSDLIDFSALLPLIKAFDELQCATRLRFSTEVFGGTWDALVDNRADLVLGAPDDSPPASLMKRELGRIPYVFAVSPQHPLAALPEPLPEHIIRKHRAAVVGDTSRRLAPRTSAVLDGQDVLTVASMQEKVLLQSSGLATGFLPLPVVTPLQAGGRLVVKQTELVREPVRLYYAWKDPNPGKALSWWIERLSELKQPIFAMEPPC